MQMTPFVLLWHHETVRNLIKTALKKSRFPSWLVHPMMCCREGSLTGKRRLFPHPALGISLGRGHCFIVTLEAEVRACGCVWITAFPSQKNLPGPDICSIILYFILTFWYFILFFFIYSIFLKFKFAQKLGHGNQQRKRSPNVFSRMTLWIFN